MDEGNDTGKLEIKGYDAAFRFAKEIFDKYPKIMKTIVLFGSYSKGKETEQSDVDIMLILDDVLNSLDQGLQGAIFADVDKLVLREKEIKLHINSVTLTAFWRGVLAADPVSINVLKYGVPLIDTGYFEPLQALLNMGEIKPTEESIYAALTRGELYSNSARLRLAGVITDVYWSVVNAAQAAIMRDGDVPPSPETIGDMLRNLERKKLIDNTYLEIFGEINKLGRDVLHGEKVPITGEKAEEIMLEGLKFNKKMSEIARKG